MTRKRLYNLRFLGLEIDVKTQQLEKLKAEVYSIPGPNLTGMPKATGGNNSRSEQLACDIVDLENTLLEIKLNYVKERIEIEKWISEIPIALTRLIFTLYFVERMKWPEVADEIGGYTESGVKMICYRYLDAECSLNR